MKNNKKYNIKNKIRLVSAASLFDGHDASINIMRRLIQAMGVEVIHLGHDRSAEEVVNTAIQEDVNGIAITSYQGGHNEYFKYVYDLLKSNSSQDIKIFGGGGGVILPNEIKNLMNYGIEKIYSPDDARKLGLDGMINHLVKKIDFPKGNFLTENILYNLKNNCFKSIAKTISSSENYRYNHNKLFNKINSISENSKTLVVGITGTGGAGKSSLVDELVRRFINDFKTKKVAILSVDPTKRKTGGALLGDRIRMNSINNSRVYMRSLATRRQNLALSSNISDAISILKVSNFDLIILETSGIGQSDSEIIEYSDISLYVMTPEYGAPSQLEKIDMLDLADLIVLNKFDRNGALDALRDIRKQYKRNHELFDMKDHEIPVYGTVSSQFNDTGVNKLYLDLLKLLNQKISKFKVKTHYNIDDKLIKNKIIKSSRVRYLSEISEIIRDYDNKVELQSKFAENLYSIHNTMNLIKNKDDKFFLKKIYNQTKNKITKENLEIIFGWENLIKKYQNPTFKYLVRDKEIKIDTKVKTLSNIEFPKVVLPKYKCWGQILKWSLQENVPGSFPFTSGIFPFKRTNEDPARMFAGEGSPERTNQRFHYLSKDLDAKRLSTAFDSVTLYGNDPDYRPDIYGKIGNAGVSVCTLDDTKILYSGFDLCDPKSSVSMTINGPAPIILAFYINTAIDQQCELYIKKNNLSKKIDLKIKKYFKNKTFFRPKYNGKLPENHNKLGLYLLGITGDKVLPMSIYNKIRLNTLIKIRGTVQADILKEDQAQNTCIFSTEFALKMMGDIQNYFILNKVTNFYSVSISGYHIAEAGANPITQLAFTLSNGFTYVEYYLSRGMKIDDFGSNLSFFFSNGIDPEYSVIGRVARRIWSKAMRYKYNASEKTQKLKYHIQTSGRSLHAQEIDFNDIRTTLQALYAIYDNCNSLHTNAYDEAITTPTEKSVRRALAIQLIINKEFGITKNENPLQGSFIIDELTNLVEEAVLNEFDKINDRGGVIGAMESMYQRGKIQEESLYYENLKHNGKLEIVGVNTFKSVDGSPTITPNEIIRSFDEEKTNQIKNMENFKKININQIDKILTKFKLSILNDKNIFHELMEIVKVASLGQITKLLFEIGGQYRRNM